GVLVAAGIGWVVYRAVGWTLYRLARRAWQGAGEQLGLSYDEATTSVPVRSTTWVDDLAMFVILAANTRINFSLSGRVHGEPVEVATERTVLGRSTVMTIDFAETVPDWLHIRKGWGAASSREWIDGEDVLVGSRSFDNQFRVRGRDEYAIRQFFVDHPIEDVLAELGQTFRNIQLVDGELRVAFPTVPRRISALVADIEALTEGAVRLRRQFEEPRTVADFHSEEADASSEVHVYETSG
ncbi:MAG: hypothetical protein ABEK29_03205, partial [Bradymonadaceae bacterium]